MMVLQACSAFPQILIAIIIGWCVSAILTYADVLSTDKNNVESYCRTDTRVNLITEAKWISFPYPGKVMSV